LAEAAAGTLMIEHRDQAGGVKRSIHLQRPWRRARYADLIHEVDAGWFERSRVEKIARCRELGVEIQPAMQEFEITQQVFEKLVEEKTIDPLFVTHLPTELVPLAKQNPDNPAEVDVFELIINGQEIAPGYSELNNPIVQRQRLLEQAGEETQKLDEDFLLALEYGMPPAGGVGIGVDRLMMLLTGAESIRDVILFPHLKPKSQE
jgi:lysyl-tRNA synthetase, class II